MRQILWFRRDLRIHDSGILAEAKDEVLPIFIFDSNILNALSADDKRVTFLFEAVRELRSQLRLLGLDLAIFYGDPIEIFSRFKEEGFDEVVASVDFDAYAKERDAKVENLLTFKRVYDCFLLHPEDVLKVDNTPYKVFTPFYKTAIVGFEDTVMLKSPAQNLKLIPWETEDITLEKMGFTAQKLPELLRQSVREKLVLFKSKVFSYDNERDYFYKEAGSDLGMYFRFGLISVKELFSIMIAWRKEGLEVETFIRQLFWREFYNYILYHFPESEIENFDGSDIPWSNDSVLFEKWCEGKTGVPIIDAAMIHLKNTGKMHNRLRMITASFLTKNLLIDWRWGEKHFAKYLLDYEASSNIGSWQWAAGTGADAAPYFRIFNPYLQSKKFDSEGLFIKSILPKIREVDAKLFHMENGLSQSIVDIKASRKLAIAVFKRAKDAA